MKKVYICSPYRAESKEKLQENIDNAISYCKEAIKENCIPIASHLYFPLMLSDDIEEERNIGITMGLQLLSECEEIWVYGKLSEGMKKELEYAKKLNKIIIYKN